eukprot:TRINITY_DN24313_c0_g1_i5.p1 TRINITY_DN24313_c0_g1~~TRINITY_DN24313_c0_g1_i5.p1  ORF type:complete len:218 (-),score=27.74 TRINITY_DN24313_c0_g1_i5:299-952(-)
MGQRGLICWLLAVLGVVDDNSFQPVVEAPWQAIQVFSALMLVTFSSNILANTGSRRCPAAVSATVMTAVSMSVGYLAQVAIFQKAPTKLALVGAFMMLLAVVSMAVVRLPPRRRETVSMLGQLRSVHPEPASPSITRESSRDTLASFIASEYAERQPPFEEMLPSLNDKPEAVRQRHLSSLNATESSSAVSDTAGASVAQATSLPLPITLGIAATGA